MPGGPAGQGVLFEQHHITPSHSGQMVGHAASDDTTANDHDAVLLCFLFAKHFHGSVDVFDMGENITIIADKQLITRVWGKQGAVAPHPNHNGPQGGEQIGQLPQRGVDHRAVIINSDAQKLRLAIHEGFDVKGRRCREPLHRRSRHLAFGADHHVNGQMVPAVQVGVNRIQIAL